MRLGAHVSIAGGFLRALDRAKRLSCSTMQIFSRSPRGGPAPTCTDEELQAFCQQRRDAGIEPLVVHCPYIINLASPDEGVWHRSVQLYTEEIQRSQTLGANYFVTHVGSHKGEGDAFGIARVAEALNRVLDQMTLSLMIVLENTAGSGQGLGWQFEQLRAIMDRVNTQRHFGICLDTAHTFAAGYPIHTEEGLEEVVRQFDDAVGLRHLKLIHLNDSKAAFDSHVDRHWHIGEGCIGLEAMRRIVNHPQLRDLPLILETPKMSARPGDREGRAGEQEDRHNLETVRSLIRNFALQNFYDSRVA